MNLALDSHPATRRLIEFADTKLGVQVHAVDVPTARKWLNILCAPELWPLYSPLGTLFGFCDMGTPDKRGQVWLREGIGRFAKSETSPLTDDLGNTREVNLFGAVAHEISHAVVGEDEDRATCYERALARTLNVSRAIRHALWKYAPDKEDAFIRNRLIDEGLLFRPGHRKAPHATPLV